jgi:membrane protein YqaA with SNARE-associated domain
MGTIANHLFSIFMGLGGLGLVFLGVLDSSFLFMPLGNDLLIVALTARSHRMLPVYAVLATAGSVLGSLLVDWVSRERGEEGLEKIASAKRLRYVKKKVKERAGMALAFAALMPPPFPFTLFLAASAALQYPRRKLLGVIAVSRLVRFLIIGLLAIAFGEEILRLAKSQAVQIGVLVLVVLSIGGSVYSLRSWFKKSKKVEPARSTA